MWETNCDDDDGENICTIYNHIICMYSPMYICTYSTCIHPLDVHHMFPGLPSTSEKKAL